MGSPSRNSEFYLKPIIQFRLDQWVTVMINFRFCNDSST